jgi:hypothetical protein
MNTKYTSSYLIGSTLSTVFLVIASVCLFAGVARMFGAFTALIHTDKIFLITLLAGFLFTFLGMYMETRYKVPITRHQLHKKRVQSRSCVWGIVTTTIAISLVLLA